MPLYEYKCLDCGKLFELLCKREQADNSHFCIYCGSFAKQTANFHDSLPIIVQVQ